MDHRPLPTPALDWPFYLVWRPRPVRQPCFFVWGHCFTELLLISFCGSARYLWGRVAGGLQGKWESRQGQRGLSRRRNPLLLSVLPRSLQDASLAPHLGECPKPSVLEGLAAKFLLPPWPAGSPSKSIYFHFIPLDLSLSYPHSWLQILGCLSAPQTGLCHPCPLSTFPQLYVCPSSTHTRVLCPLGVEPTLLHNKLGNFFISLEPNERQQRQ